MTKHIKNLFCIIFLIILPSLISCGKKDETTNVTNQPTKVAKYKVEISDLDYGFIKVDSVLDDSELELSMSSKPSTFYVGEQYYLIIDFDATTRNINLGDLLLYTEVSFNSVTLLDGSIYTSTTGNEPSKTTMKDSITGEDKIELKLAHSLPKSEDETYEIKLVLKISTLKSGEPRINFNFSGSDIEFIFTGMSGFNKAVTIKKVQLETPILKFDDEKGELVWNHVKYADYYKIYVDGIVLKDENNNDYFKEVDQYVSVGMPVSYISEYLTGYHIVKVQAFSNNADYLVSNYSNEVITNS